MAPRGYRVRKYLVRNDLKGFRRDKDPSGEIHRRNALGMSSGRGVAGGRAERDINMTRSLQPSFNNEESQGPVQVADVPETAPLPLNDQEYVQLEAQPINAEANEQIEEQTIAEESSTGLPGANAGAAVIPVSSGAPSSPAYLGAERSPITFSAKKKVTVPWLTR